MGPKLAGNILAAIQNSKKTSLDRVIYAIGILHVGDHIAKLLAREFVILDELSRASLEKLTSIKGIGKGDRVCVVQFFQQEGNRRAIKKLEEFGVQYPSTAPPSAKTAHWRDAASFLPAP